LVLEPNFVIKMSGDGGDDAAKSIDMAQPKENTATVTA
jgi:hypothetical protein